jgi:hypothetical protein
VVLQDPSLKAIILKDPKWPLAEHRIHPHAMATALKLLDTGCSFADDGIVINYTTLFGWTVTFNDRTWESNAVQLYHRLKEEAYMSHRFSRGAYPNLPHDASPFVGEWHASLSSNRKLPFRVQVWQVQPGERSKTAGLPTVPPVAVDKQVIMPASVGMV